MSQLSGRHGTVALLIPRLGISGGVMLGIDYMYSASTFDEIDRVGHSRFEGDFLEPLLEGVCSIIQKLLILLSRKHPASVGGERRQNVDSADIEEDRKPVLVRRGA